MSENIRGKLVLKLKEIFRSDRSDLDFGIYRILKQRRNEINRYIEEDLVRKAEEEFGELAKADLKSTEAELGKLVDEINRDFGTGTIDENGEVTRNHKAPKIKQYVEKKKKFSEGEQVQTQINDVFNHIYEFFNRYYDKGDFISQRRFGGREKYILPYNGDEVFLYWANQDQYYVKTTENYYKYSFKIGDFLIIFRLVIVDIIQNNISKDNSFFQIHREKPLIFSKDKREIEIIFEHRFLSEEDLDFYNLSKRSQKKTKEISILDKNFNVIIEQLNKMGDILKPITQSKKLKENLFQYVSKNDMDYFIHKNLKDFLRKELDFYIKNEVVDMDEWLSHDENNIRDIRNKIKAIRSLSNNIIDFLDEIEKFQVFLFEKKKFVLKTDYCITLDLVPKEFYKEIGKNERQVEEWKRLFKLDEIQKDTLHSTIGRRHLDAYFLKLHKYLVLDTKFFCKEFKNRLLSTFDYLDDAIGGVIIKSENWQILNMLLSKYRHKAAVIYLDPPYNTGNDEFLFKDKYRHSSWLSMLADRLNLAKKIMSNTGSIFVSCDDHEMKRLSLLMDSIFGHNNFIATIIWEKVHTRKNSAKFFSVSHDYILCYSKLRSDWRRILLPRENTSAYSNPDNDPKGPWKSDPVYAHNPYSADYVITKPNGIKVHPPPGSYWRFSEKNFHEKVKRGEVRWGQGDSLPLIKRYLSEVQQGLVPVTLFTRKFAGDNSYASKESRDLFAKVGLISYPKPTKLIERLLQITTKDNDIVLDFFAGSGTTAHAVLNLNKKDGGTRKYILVEMANYFDTLMIPRIKKVMFSKDWKDGRPISIEGTRLMLE